METRYQAHSKKMNEQMGSNRFGYELFNGVHCKPENIIEARRMYAIDKEKGETHIIFWQSGILFLDGEEMEMSEYDAGKLMNKKRKEWLGDAA